MNIEGFFFIMCSSCCDKRHLAWASVVRRPSWVALRLVFFVFFCFVLQAIGTWKCVLVSVCFMWFCSRLFMFVVFRSGVYRACVCMHVYAHSSCQRKELAHAIGLVS